MLDYGITPEGFERKRLDVLLEEMNEAVRSVFGENINLSPESPDGQINGLVSGSNANLWELLEKAYDAFNPSAASGAALSNLVQLNGILRLPATKSRALLTLSGANATTVPAGALVATADTGTLFATETSVTIGLSGLVQVYARAVNTGPVIALAGTLTKIKTPITGWSGVTNLADALVGTNIETDPELRARRERSVSVAAQAVIDAIYAAVANVPGVEQVAVLENDTNATDGNGLPPHSFAVIASGGTEQDIADQIWLKKPAGITTFGDIAVVVEDSQGFPHTMNFSRPTEIPIFVEVNLTTIPGEYPVDGDDQIKQAIVDYANLNFVLGDDVIYSRLYTPINSVPGHQVDSLFIATSSPPGGTSNISIGVNESSKFTLANIVVTS
jgi:uncharacterized phage protein gp47/JayE